MAEELSKSKDVSVGVLVFTLTGFLANCGQEPHKPQRNRHEAFIFIQVLPAACHNKGTHCIAHSFGWNPALLMEKSNLMLLIVPLLCRKCHYEGDDEKKLDFCYKNLFMSLFMKFLQSPSKYSPLGAMHLSNLFSHC